MRRSGKGSGGGAGMNKNVSPPVRYGQARKEKRVAAVSQIGQSMGNHVTDRRQVVNPIERLEGRQGISVPLGNEVARNVGGGGPGAGRVVMKTGSQSTHGSVNPGRSTPARDILNDFGPDSAGVRSRR
jgi:hypothetical protein